MTNHISDIPLAIIVDVISIISIACFGWAWKLQNQVTKLKAIQEIKTARLDHIDRVLANLSNQVNEISGQLKIIANKD